MICRASHSAVGCRVTSNHSSCRRPWPSTRNANNRSKVRVGTTHRSMAAIACAWFRRNVFQLCDGGPPSHHVFRDRRLGDLKAKHQQFAMDPGCSPLRVFPAHPSDQVTQAPIDLRPPCPLSRFPAPERLEARTVPPQDRLRLNDLGRTEQARPEPGHPDQQRPVTAAQPKTRRRPPQGDAELMAKEQVLGFKPAPRLEQVDDEHSERVQDREHRSEHAMISALRRESRPDEIFGKDNWTSAANRASVCPSY